MAGEAHIFPPFQAEYLRALQGGRYHPPKRRPPASVSLLDRMPPVIYQQALRGTCVANAVTAQRQMKEEEQAFCNPPMPAGGPVEKAGKLPQAAKKPNPVGNYLTNEISQMQEELNLPSYDEAKAKFNEMVGVLERGKAIEPVNWKTITMDQAKNIVAAVKKNFLQGDVA